MSAIARLSEVAERFGAKRSSARQLDLGHDESGIDSDRARALLAWARQVVAHRQPKAAADDMGMSASYLSHALQERNGNRLPMSAVPYLIRTAPNDDGLRMLASWRGLELTRPIPVSTEDALMGLLQAIGEQLGPIVAGPLLDSGYEIALERARGPR